MDEIRCAIELRENEGKPARLVGVLMPYGERAKDRAEIFERGSLSWDERGIIVNRMHQRASPIMRCVPIEKGGKLVIDSLIPSTTAGADCEAEIRAGLLTSLSVEFRSVRERFVGGVRHLSEAVLTGAGLVDAGAYESATVEARAKVEAAALRERESVEFLL